MDYTSASGHTTDAKGRRQFVDRDIVNGVAGTSLVAADMNAIQNTLMAALVAYGVTPDATDDGLLVTAIANAVAPLRQHGMAVFTKSGTFLVPAGVTTLDIEVWGGGGSGGGSVGQAGAGAGGGGGGYARGRFTVVPGTQYTVTVGAGAAGVAGANGTNGGTTSVGTLISGIGGSFGLAGNGTTASVGWGYGGDGYGGTLIIKGANGQGAGSLAAPAEVGQSGTVLSGQGGSTFGASYASAVTGQGAGPDGIFPGGGGSGSSGDGQHGGAGAAGLAVIVW